MCVCACVCVCVCVCACVCVCVCVCVSVACTVGRPKDITRLWDYGKISVPQFLLAMQSKCSDGSEQGKLHFSYLALDCCALQNPHVET